LRTCRVEMQLEEEVLSNQTGSVKSTEKQGDEKASNEDGPRHCHCGQHCRACIAEPAFVVTKFRTTVGLSNNIHWLL
jgi:hypothetical protein